MIEINRLCECGCAGVLRSVLIGESKWFDIKGEEWFFVACQDRFCGAQAIEAKSKDAAIYFWNHNEMAYAPSGDTRTMDEILKERSTP
jgi:hypothetical protein